MNMMKVNVLVVEKKTKTRKMMIKNKHKQINKKKVDVVEVQEVAVMTIRKKIKNLVGVIVAVALTVAKLKRKKLMGNKLK